MIRMDIDAVKCDRFDECHVVTKDGIAQSVKFGDKELNGVTNLHIEYGIDELPQVTVTLYARDIHIEPKDGDKNE